VQVVGAFFSDGDSTRLCRVLELSVASPRDLALPVAIPVNRLAAAALAEFLSRRRSCERAAEAAMRWSRAA
jgi:hypothetical protein